MYLLFLLGWNLHIVAIEVTQVSVGVTRCAENLALEGDGSQWEYRILTVHDTIAVVNQDIREIDILGTDGTEQCPKNFVQQILRTKPEELRKGTQGIIVGLVQDGVTA